MDPVEQQVEIRFCQLLGKLASERLQLLQICGKQLITSLFLHGITVKQVQ
jgi:hypothetical protein